MSASNVLARRLFPGHVKRLVADWICHDRVGNFLARAFSDRIPTSGLRVQTSAPIVSPRTKAQIFWGIYESAEIRFIQRFLRSDLDVVELGSSLGVTSCHIARSLDPGRRLVCVEANPALVSVIETNLQSNIPGVECTVINRAIDYDPTRGWAPLVSGATTAASRVGVAQGARPSIQSVSTTRLCEILRETGIDRYVLVCDIEGAEAGLIQEEADALERCEQLLIELHDTEFRGSRLGWEELADAIQNRCQMRLRAAYGPVHVFER